MFLWHGMYGAYSKAACVCVSVQECVPVCVRVYSIAFYQVEWHQFHNCAMQDMALDFSSENGGVLALS